MDKHLTRPVRSMAAIALAAMLAACQTTVPLTWKVPEGVKTVVVNGYPLAYSEAGSGPTVVMVHGVLCDYRCFGAQQRALADTYHVVSVSTRHSYPQEWDGSGKTFTLAQHADDLAAFLEKMNPPVRLVGHSYGGLIASEVARRRPELVARLVLAEAPTSGVLGPETDEQVASRSRIRDKLETTYRELPYEDAVRYSIDMINGEGAWSRFPEPVRSIFKANGWTVVGSFRDTPRRTSCEEFGTLRMPVLLVTGERTSATFRNIVQAQARCLPAARVVTIPNAGHAVQANPDVFNATLREFLR